MTAFTPIQLHGAQGAGATLYPYGAHVISWRGNDGSERLFTSTAADLRPGAAIRGGVPIIFPQFADLGSLPKHGLARIAEWQPLNVAADQALLQWQSSAATQAIWPQQFSAEYHLQLHVEALTMTLSIINTGAQEFSFTAALHTYLRVADIAQVRIAGLQNLRYRDKAAGGSEAVQGTPTLAIVDEVDRIYFSAREPITVLEPGQRSIECRAEGFADAVIWNPGATISAGLKDMEPDGYRRMVCVEAAAIAQPIVLAPAESWSGSQTLSLR